MATLAYFKFFLQGASIGLRGFSLAGIKAAGIKRTLGFFLQPVENWSRYPELLTVYRCLEDTDGKKILDAGSPKMLGFLLARNHKADLLLTDIWDVAVREVSALHRRNKDQLKGSIKLDVADLTALNSIQDESFDAVYSVSVLEHIEDLAAIRRGLTEMARVTKKDGLLVISVPIRDQYFQEFFKEKVYGQNLTEGSVFFSHYFDQPKTLEVFGDHPKLKLEQAFISQWDIRSALLSFWRKVPQKIRGLCGFVNMLIAPYVTRVVEIDTDLRQCRFPEAGDLILKYRKIS